MPPVPYDLNFLRDLLITALSSGAAGLGVLAILDRVTLPMWIEDDILYKRVLAFALGTALAGLLYGAALLMLYVPLPTDWRQLVEVLASLGSLAFTVSQGGHAVVEKRRRDRAAATLRKAIADHNLEAMTAEQIYQTHLDWDWYDDEEDCEDDGAGLA